MLSRRSFLKTCLLVITQSLFSSVLPDIGDSDRSVLTPAKAENLSKQILLNIINSNSLMSDFDIIEYLNYIGNNLASFTLSENIIQFFLINDQSINAFAIPSAICVNIGLLHATTSEAELAAVLAHEIAHITQHHIFRTIAENKRTEIASLAGLIASALLAPLAPSVALLSMYGSQGIAIANILSFSRDYEREADRIGQQIMAQAGFDAGAMPSFFQHLADQEKFNKNTLAFLQNHPVTLDRLSEAEVRASKIGRVMRQSSIDFLLAKEKARLYCVGTTVIDFYKKSIKDERYIDLNSQYYGISNAYLANKQLELSVNYFNKIKNISSVFLFTLSAQQSILAGKYETANAIYEKAMSQYPQSKALWVGKLDMLIKTKQYSTALTTIKQKSNLANDTDVLNRSIFLYSDAALNMAIDYHFAIGKKANILGDKKTAKLQYNIAVSIPPKSIYDKNLQSLIRSQINLVSQ